MAKQKTDTPKPKADIDFEKHLWDAANELRGAVAENQYKDYVLSLWFVKHLSERFEIRKQELTNMVNEPESEYYTTKPKEKERIINDELEYQVKNAYKLPLEATWAYLQQHATQNDIKVKVDNAFVLIDEILS